jgi:hypothetical protein
MTGANSTTSHEQNRFDHQEFAKNGKRGGNIKTF